MRMCETCAVACVTAAMLELCPITLREAYAYVDAHHRHHRSPQGALFAIAVSDGEVVRGVAIVGRPVARGNDDGYTVEVTRLCTDGARNACSMLYRASWRAARAMGYRRCVTYTLADENGASLRGAGFRCVGQTRGGSWSCRVRPRVDTHPIQGKLRWQVDD